MVLYFDQLHDQQLDNHDRRLGFHWNVPGLARALGLCVPRKLEAAVSSVLAEAILAAESGKAVSYSRNRNFYSNSRRYRGTAYTYSTVLRSVALVHNAGLIIDRQVPPGHLGWQSSFAATERLVEACLGVNPSMTYADAEIIWAPTTRAGGVQRLPRQSCDPDTRRRTARPPHCDRRVLHPTYPG